MLPALITQFIAGGLGNQLFDYAASRTLADRHQAQLILDPSLLSSSPARPFCLGGFSVRATIRQSRSSAHPGLLRRLFRRVREDLFAHTFVRPPSDCGFCEEFLSLPRRCIIRSHLLSPTFFAGNHERIRSDIKIIDRTILDSARVAKFFRTATQADTVAVHVRRGDMLQPEHAHLRLEGLDQYFSRSMDRIEDALGRARFLVFSDDPTWCQTAALFRGRNFQVVSVDSTCRETVLEDFLLMSACPHIIMPNSAFSWWAAFARKEAGYTCVPAKWTPSDVVTIDEMRLSSWREP